MTRKPQALCGSAAVPLLALATLAACASEIPLRIEAERSPTADFYTYRTYAWMFPPLQETAQRPRGGRALLDWRIRSAVDRQLSARGFEKASSGRPDLLIDYHIELREKNTETFSDYLAYRKSGGQEWLTEAYVFGYQEGTLTIEIDDAATRHLLWRASATGLVEPERQEERVNAAVQRMFERFP